MRIKHYFQITALHISLKYYITFLTIIGMALSTAVAAQTGSDCTNPPNLVPFADLRNCDLSGRDMEAVDISYANLTGANLDDVNLDISIARGTIFDNATLRGTRMEDMQASDASFVEADLRGADMYFARVHNANLSGVDFSNTWVNRIDLRGSNLQNAVFTGSMLRSMNLANTDMRGVDLRFTRIWYGTMRNADLRNANFEGASILGTFSYMFDGATWGNTICPDGSNSDDNDGDNFTCQNN